MENILDISRRCNLHNIPNNETSPPSEYFSPKINSPSSSMLTSSSPLFTPSKDFQPPFPHNIDSTPTSHPKPSSTPKALFQSTTLSHFPPLDTFTQLPPLPLPFDRSDGAWVEKISNHGGERSLSSLNKNRNVFVSFIAFRYTSPSIDSQAWASFTEKCEKLMLMQWEHEASEGSDPEDMRRFFKIVWVEDVDVQQVHMDLGLLRGKFQDAKAPKPRISSSHPLPPSST